jgi:hypothetical protein
MNKVVSVFSLFCGAGMLLTWAILFLTSRVPEMETEPFQATFLLAAEVLTAISLLAAGYGLISGRSWGQRLMLVGLGMLVYCAVYSIGVFSQAGNAPATGFFVAIAVMALVFSVGLVKQPTQE